MICITSSLMVKSPDGMQLLLQLSYGMDMSMGAFRGGGFRSDIEIDPLGEKLESVWVRD